MWLINTNTLRIHQFVGKAIPKYAILSHTWSTDEVSFQELSLSSSQAKNGYSKIKMTCQLASQAGLQYAWVDTCCIDKSSSAELSEAINSMFRWYERSEFCVVYLDDLPAEGALVAHLHCCRWFTRGWTLQELIAPNNVHFYDQSWIFRGSKQDLIEHLTLITGIDRAVLQKQQPLSTITVARKFSWAAHRMTSRVEDTAYCLLGLFDINMPLLYGEEERAFGRLQTEIINTTPDLSIFAWKLPSTPGSRARQTGRVYSGLLAESPLAFSKSSYCTIPFSSPRRDFVVTNTGIKTRTQLATEFFPGKQGSRYILPLDCCGNSGKPLGIRLRRCGLDQFVRDGPYDLLERESFDISYAPKERYLLTRLPGRPVSSDQDARIQFVSDFSIAQFRSHVLQTKRPPSMRFSNAWPLGRWDDEDQLFFVQGDTRWDSAAIRISAFIDFKREGQRNINVDLQCMFFALGWSDTQGKALQCSILEFSPSTLVLKEVQSQLVEWDPDRLGVIQLLEHHKIPKSSLAAIKILGTDCSALVSFKPTLVRDPNVCANEYWCLEFFYEIYQDEDLPEIYYERWSRKI